MSEISRALKVTQPAVTQYLNHKRGARIRDVASVDTLLDPLVEKLVGRIPTGVGVETAELLETARQIIVMNSGRAIVGQNTEELGRSRVLELLRSRLRLELNAAEKYLELANRTPDDYTKLLLRMIAADSIRHGDIVSQLMSWLEAGGESTGIIPDEALLRSMLAVEDSAGEESLVKEVDVGHPVARLLLKWIDMDEIKHEQMVNELVYSNAQAKKATTRAKHA